jgi:DNA-binding CsgD family transcriptional regulator
VGAALSWENIEHELRAVAEEVCTPAELEALKLHEAGVAYRATAAILGISWSTARERVQNAQRKLEEAERRRAGRGRARGHARVRGEA